jgi:hypothetical protein
MVEECLKEESRVIARVREYHRTRCMIEYNNMKEKLKEL